MLWAGSPTLFLILALFFEATVAQSSDVTQCIPGYEWVFNSRGQSPCLVAAYLETSCTGQPIAVNTIPPENHYQGPNFAQADPCKCSTIVYSLISACGGCQNRSFTTWDTWILNCSTVEFTVFPKPIPPEVEVPSWAYLNISQTNNTFDPTVAQKDTTQSSSAAVHSSTAAPTDIPPSAIHTSSSSTTNAGAIAGGVVGGIFFVSAVALCIFWFFLRSRSPWGRKQRPNLVDLDEDYIPASPPPMHESGFTTSRTITTPMSANPVPYIHPQDFGINSPDSARFTTLRGRSSTDSLPYTTSQMARASYSGAPEV